jgi:hypothetical protein
MGGGMSLVGWPFILVLGFGTLLAIVLLAGSRRVVRTGRCPVTGRYVVVELQETVSMGRTTDVGSCSMFTPSTVVTCDKACLRRPA